MTNATTELSISAIFPRNGHPKGLGSLGDGKILIEFILLEALAQSSKPNQKVFKEVGPDVICVSQRL